MIGAPQLVIRTVAFPVCLLGLACCSGHARADERLDHFENKIRPVLVAECLSCHGDDPDDLGGGLSLLSVDDMREGGDTGPAIDDADAQATMLIKAMRYDGDIKMPPDGKLPDHVIRDFERWLEDGAVDPRSRVAKQHNATRDFAAERQHWAFQPLAPATDVEPNPNASGAIDSLIDNTLASHGLSRSARAAPATMLRRLCDDLTGLPPSAEMLTRFLADPCDASYLRIVDELLASEEFGRHWGRHWLDVARYADSNGSDFNATFHHAWRYRDYVIDSFNQDKPFDRFVTEQIAGDLLDSEDSAERTAQLVATGFLMLGPKMLSERDKAKLQMDVVDDQIDTIGRAIIGLTLGCARCHDHKFDPIPTTDYYALAGIFRSTQVLEGELQKYVSHWVERPLPANDSLIAAHATFEQQERQLTSRIKEWEAKRKAASDIAEADADSIVLDDQQAKRTGDWVESTYSQPYIAKGYLHDNNRNKGECALSFEVELQPGQYELSLAYTAYSNRSRSTPIELIADGVAQSFVVDQTRKPKSLPWHAITSLTLMQPSKTQVIVRNEGTDGYVLVDAIRFTRKNVEVATDETDATQRKRNNAVADEVKRIEAELAQAKEQLAALRANKPAPLPKAMAVRDAKTIADAFVCIRGEVHLQGPTVPRGYLQACQPEAFEDSSSAHFQPAMPANQSGRLQFAQWLCDPDHPLTSRVFVNRVWMHLMGEGLVRTVDNFGLLGDRPSHPELLDLLASDFLRSGWSIKNLVRVIVCSETYRQSSIYNPAASALDPENRWMWRMNRKRRSAESIRDSLLVSTHRLDRTSSVAPMARFGSLVAENVANPKEIKSSEGTRRSVYMPIIRGQVNELLATFDFADPDLLVGKRERTNVPSQSLMLLNGRWLQDQIAELTTILSQQYPARDSFIRELYLRLLSRYPTSTEQQTMAAFLSVDDSVNRQQLVGAIVGSSEFRLLD